MANFGRRNNKTNNNNESSKKNLNTQLRPQFYPTGENNCLSTLIVGLWNQYVSIKIVPELPSNEQTNNNVYDYENGGLSVLLHPTQIQSLKKAVAVMKKNDKYQNATLTCMNDTVIKISTGEEYGLNNWTVSIIDLSGKKPDGLHYVFNFDSPDQSVFMNFDEDKNIGKSQTFKSAEFDMFMELLNIACYALSGAYTHQLNTIVRDILRNTMNGSGSSAPSGNRFNNSSRARIGSGRGRSTDDEEQPTRSISRKSSSHKEEDLDDDYESTSIEESDLDDVASLLAEEDDE